MDDVFDDERDAEVGVHSTMSVSSEHADDYSPSVGEKRMCSNQMLLK